MHVLTVYYPAFLQSGVTHTRHGNKHITGRILNEFRHCNQFDASLSRCTMPLRRLPGLVRAGKSCKSWISCLSEDHCRFIQLPYNDSQQLEKL